MATMIAGRCFACHDPCEQAEACRKCRRWHAFGIALERGVLGADCARTARQPGRPANYLWKLTRRIAALEFAIDALQADHRATFDWAMR